MKNPAARKRNIVRVAAVSYLVGDEPHTAERNERLCAAYVDEAADRGADIVCFPEYVTGAGMEAAAADVTETQVHRWGDFFSTLARTRGVNIIAPYLVRSRGRLYSQATLFDRRGGIAGRYRKVQLNGAELPLLAAGDSLPVFRLEGCPLAVMLCFEIHFPEIPRIYAWKGARIVFWPTMTYGPSQESLLAQARARAVDNSIAVVEANYASPPPYAPYAGRFLPGNARVIDHNGDILAQTGRRGGLAVADLDLDETRLTSRTVLLREPDHIREDLASLARYDLYAREYARMAARRDPRRGPRGGRRRGPESMP